jgi:protein-S-isoprenylcysteine O-methyltransferase Ste14
MTVQETDHKRIRFYPPLLYLGFLALGFVMEFLLPTKIFNPSLSQLLGFSFPGLGVVVIVFSLMQFRDAETSVFHTRPTTKLVQTGIYHLSRNPIYVGLTLIYAGIGFAANNLWILGFLVVIFPLMNWGVIGPEEIFLEEKFGNAYRHYKYHVRRWL